jgi:HlyD family secretion protein
VKKLLLFLVLVGAGLVGIAVWINLPRSLSVSEKIFTYATVEKGDMMESISATGVVSIQANQMLLVSAEMPGTAVAIHGKVNDLVPEGATLLKLDDRKIQLKLEEANNGLETAKAGLEQAKAMLDAAKLALKYQKEIESKGGFRSERDEAEVKVKAAQAGVAMARTRVQAARIGQREAELALELTRVKVPVVTKSALAEAGKAGGNGSSVLPSGREYLIVECKVKLGQMVGPAGEPLFVLARDLERMEVHAQVAEGDIGRVKKGLEAGFTVTAFSEENIVFRGKVSEIRPMPNNLKGAIFYDTVVLVDNQKESETGEWRLRPGMTAAMDIIRREHKNVWKVPTAALNFQMEEAYQSAAAQEHLAEWRDRPDGAAWKPVWVWDSEQSRVWPIMVRIGGVNAKREPGLKDGSFNEVLEWEPGHEPNPAAPPRVITNAPPASAPGFFDKPANLKVS